MSIMQAISYILVTMFLGLFMITAAAEIAGAQERRCLSVDAGVEQLTNEYKEIMIGHMKDDQNVPMQIWANLDNGTWTITYMTGDESNTLLCLLDKGHSFKVGAPR